MSFAETALSISGTHIHKYIVIERSKLPRVGDHLLATLIQDNDKLVHSVQAFSLGSSEWLETKPSANWCGRQGSNLRHRAWKDRALPTELLPQTFKFIISSFYELFFVHYNCLYTGIMPHPV